jgi:putative colanic acid biosynthesis acetyltransferase WcaF
MRLDAFENAAFDRQRPAVVEGLWILVQAAFVRSFIPGSAHRRLLLRAFGAQVGRGVVIKPGVRVKFPWKLEVGDHSWIGEGVWIDNLAPVRIGSNCCVSQAAYLCTGSHDWSSPSFDLIVKPIEVRASAWIAARAVLGPGVVVGEGAVLTLGSVATGALEPWTVYAGHPARRVRKRLLTSTGHPASTGPA